jgi:hypothetical protein
VIRLMQSLNEQPEQTAVTLPAPVVDAHGDVLASDRPCERLESAANWPGVHAGARMTSLTCVKGLLLLVAHRGLRATT